MTRREIAIKAFNQLENEFSGHDFARLCEKYGLNKLIKNQSSRINFRTMFCKNYANKLTLKTWKKKNDGSIHEINFKPNALGKQVKIELDNLLNPAKKRDAVFTLLDFAKELNNNNDKAVLIKAALMIIENN